MVYAISINTTEMERVFGRGETYWFGRANTVPFAPTAGDALDHQISLTIMPTSASRILDKFSDSALTNLLLQEDKSLPAEQLALWAEIAANHEVGLAAAIVLPDKKFQELDSALMQYHPTASQFSVLLSDKSVLQSLDIASGSSRTQFLNRAPFVERQQFEFSVSCA